MVTSVQPVTITNVLDITSEHLAYFLNRNILSNKIPQFTPNHPVSVQHDLIPRLGKYANDLAYITELYNIVISGLYIQKNYKRSKDELYDSDIHNTLEAKKEILYRTSQAINRLYEAASRLMTGIGAPDSSMGRY
jgi:hypothetical protein